MYLLSRLIKRYKLRFRGTQRYEKCACQVEQYANIVGTPCYNNLEGFIDALSTLDNKQAEQIYKFLEYNFSYKDVIDKDSLKKQLNTLLNSQKTTKAQKEVIKKLIGILQ